MRRLLLIAVLLLVSIGMSADAREGAVTARIPDLAGRAVVIEATVAQVVIEGWAQPGMDVEIVPEGRAAAVASVLDMRVLETADEVTVRAVQPDDAKDADAKARVTVRLPATAVVRRASVFEGSLTLQEMRGEVQAAIERGPLTGRNVSGILRLETRSGDMSLTGAELSSPGLLRLRTFNGSVTLGLVRRPANARVLALTMNGTIESDLPLSERAGFGPRFREGVFGSGEPLISIDVVRGNIAITAPGR